MLSKLLNSFLNEDAEFFKDRHLHYPFPSDAFPSEVQTFIEEVSKALPCPADYVGLGLIIAAGSVLGKVRQIRLKKTWVERASFYGAIIGPPGSLKSPAINAVIAPIKRMEQQYKEEFSEKESQWKQDIVVWKTANRLYQSDLKESLKLKSKLPEPIGPAPAHPIRKQITVQDITSESLCENLVLNSRGLFLLRDELLGFMNGMNQYRGGGKGSDRQFYLSLWDGKGTIKVSRKSKGQDILEVDEPFFSLLGSIQPDLLSQLESERGKEDGWLPRFLYVIPNTPSMPTLETSFDVSDKAIEDWNRILNSLRSLYWDEKQIPDFNDEGEQGTKFINVPMELVMSPEAWQLFNEWYEADRLEANQDSFPIYLLASWSKMKAYCARFALLIHCLRQVCGEQVDPKVVDKQSVENAIKLTRYFQIQCSRVFEAIQFCSRDRDIEDFVRWMKSEGGIVLFAEIIKKKKWGIKGRQSAYKFCNEVADRQLGAFSVLEGETVFKLKEELIPI